MRGKLATTRLVLMLGVLLGVGTLVVAPLPAAAHSLEVSPLVRSSAGVSGRILTRQTVEGTDMHTLGWLMSSPFWLCRNDRAYILGFRQADGTFVDGIIADWGDVRLQLLYLWCPSWVPGASYGLNFAELQIQNTGSVCEVFTLGKPETGYGFSFTTNPMFTLTTYSGLGLVDPTGLIMDTPAPPRSTQTLCPGQRTTWFSGVANGRYAYYALAFFDVSVPAWDGGWTNSLATPYPR